MEGPSLYLAAEQLQPFVGRRIDAVAGNSRIGIDRLSGQVVSEIFSWGKHLVFQFSDVALRVHFMLWGTFAATVNGESLTGDYRRSGPPRLVLTCANGDITIWAASIRFVEESNARAAYDFTADVMSEHWDAKGALRKVRAFPRAEIADVLLDQEIFAGVGNIIKNEVLFRMRVSPFARVHRLSDDTLKRIIKDARVFSFRFLELRRVFALRRNLDVYRRSVCPRCGNAIERLVHGQRARRSFFCRTCQRVRISAAATLPTARSRSGRSTRTVPRRGAGVQPRRGPPKARG